MVKHGTLTSDLVVRIPQPLPFRVAQWLEQASYKRQVTGSTPVANTICSHSSVGRAHDF